MPRAHRHWSGKHKRVARGITLVTLLWTDGGAKLPLDCRLSNTPGDGLDKNQHFRAVLQTAKDRDFSPAYVAFDSWYWGLDNLKAIRSHDWQWLTRFKSNRAVDPDGTGNRAVDPDGTGNRAVDPDGTGNRAVDPDSTGNRQIDLLNIPEDGLVVPRRGYGRIKVFARVAPDMEEAAFWATSDLSMTEAKRPQVADGALAIEEYHRGLKQCCGVERCQARSERAQRNRILLAIRAFVRLEWQRAQTGRSGYESKKQIVHDVIRAYRASPTLTLAKT